MSTLERMAKEAALERLEEERAENERLRELLAIARGALSCAVQVMDAYHHPAAVTYAGAYRRSDPDVQPESGE